MNKHFPDRLEVSPLFGGKWKKRRVLSDFRYFPDPDGSPIIVPAEFLTDYASVPRFLWSIIPSWGKHGPAAIVHDYLYAAQKGKWYADWVFMLAMKQLGVGRCKRWAMFIAVALFGLRAYKKIKKRRLKNEHNNRMDHVKPRSGNRSGRNRS